MSMATDAMAKVIEVLKQLASLTVTVEQMQKQFADFRQDIEARHALLRDDTRSATAYHEKRTEDRANALETRVEGRMGNVEDRVAGEVAKVECRLVAEIDRLRRQVDELSAKVGVLGVKTDGAYIEVLRKAMLEPTNHEKFKSVLPVELSPKNQSDDGD